MPLFCEMTVVFTRDGLKRLEEGVRGWVMESEKEEQGIYRLRELIVRYSV